LLQSKAKNPFLIISGLGRLTLGRATSGGLASHV
jgi:hypothetical protein